MSVQFRPITPTNSTFYDVLINGRVVGTFEWSLRVSNPPSKVGIVHWIGESDGDMPCVVPDERGAVAWLLKREGEAAVSVGAEAML